MKLLLFFVSFLLILTSCQKEDSYPSIGSTAGNGNNTTVDSSFFYKEYNSVLRLKSHNELRVNGTQIQKIVPKSNSVYQTYDVDYDGNKDIELEISHYANNENFPSNISFSVKINCYGDYEVFTSTLDSYAIQRGSGSVIDENHFSLWDSNAFLFNQNNSAPSGFVFLGFRNKATNSYGYLEWEFDSYEFRIKKVAFDLSGDGNIITGQRSK